jgi:hypothetical protein
MDGDVRRVPGTITIRVDTGARASRGRRPKKIHQGMVGSPGTGWNSSG